MQLDGLADLVIFVVAEQAPLFRLEQPVPLKEHGVDGIVILPRQFRRHGQDLIVCDGSLALAAEELIERHLQRVDKLRQQRDVGTADIALPFGNGLIAHAESVCQCLLRQSFFFTAAQNARAHCRFFQVVYPPALRYNNKVSVGNAMRGCPASNGKSGADVSLIFRQHIACKRLIADRNMLVLPCPVLQPRL